MNDNHQNNTWQPQAETAQAGKYHVEVIAEKCISDGSCIAFAPEVFKFNAQDIAEVFNQNGNDDATKLLAAQVCPGKAIVVTDTETGQRIWPLD